MKIQIPKRQGLCRIGGGYVDFGFRGWLAGKNWGVSLDRINKICMIDVEFCAGDRSAKRSLLHRPEL